MSTTTAEELKQETENFGWAVIAVALTLAVVMLLLWPLGRVRLAIDVARSAGLFYLVVWAAWAALGLIHRRLRVNLYDHADAFLLSNAAVSGLLVAGWAAWAALAVRASTAGAAAWRAALLYAVGLLVVHLGYGVVSAYYPGTFYRYKNLPLAAGAYLLFALWPAAARFLFGWLFRLV